MNYAINYEYCEHDHCANQNPNKWGIIIHRSEAMSVWLPSLTMGIGRGETERQKEYLIAMERLVVEEKRKLRNDTIEECALMVEQCDNFALSASIQSEIAAAIRALKDKV